MRYFVLLIAILSVALLSGCGKYELQAGTTTLPPVVTAAVIPVKTESFEASLAITGTLVSNSRVDVKAETVGRITRFDKEEGAHVRAGEAIAWVNDENFQLSLRQAQTAVKVAETGVERARLLESHSRSELERAERLLSSGGITDKDLKAAQLADRDARAQVAFAEAQLDQARAALEVASKHVRDAVIKSPISGEIQKKLVNPGAYVEPPTPVFTIVDNGRLELEAAVASSDLAPVRPGLPVTFTVNSYPGEAFAGRVIELAPAVDEQTRAAKVRIRVDNAASKLRAGMFAQGEIRTGVNEAAIVIPPGAVYRDDRSAKSCFVFVVENGKAAKRMVRIGQERETKLEIAEGLKPGDRLIAEQNLEIAEGVRVEARR